MNIISPCHLSLFPNSEVKGDIENIVDNNIAIKTKIIKKGIFNFLSINTECIKNKNIIKDDSILK